MKITEGSIDYNAVRLISELISSGYEMITVTGGEGDYSVSEERGYMLMTLGEIQGICEMAKTMKEVLKS